MAKRGKRGLFGISMLVGCVVAIGALAFYILSNSSIVATANNSTANNSIETGSIVKASSQKTDQPNNETGPSGLPVPRFVSLKRSKVNVRRGPSNEHKIAWIFKFKGLPVEIIAEFEHWRRIRDSEGQEGWVYQSLLTGKRMISVAPWRKGAAIQLRDEPTPAATVLANVSAGAVGEVKKCTGNWCNVALGSYQGWISQSMLWGVYPDEKIAK
jgi:SH3-like domain-containing protein